MNNFTLEGEQFYSEQHCGKTSDTDVTSDKRSPKTSKCVEKINRMAFWEWKTSVENHSSFRNNNYCKLKT